MRAIVLSYDANSDIAENMVRSYNKLWPDHPFEFLLPYQTPSDTQLANCTYVESPPEINRTVLTLLNGIPDDEWVYWAYDDLYPMWLDRPALRDVMDQLRDGARDELACVAFSTTNLGARKNYRKKIAAEPEPIRIGNLKALELSDYDEIFVNLFIRAGALRYFFEQLPEPGNGAKEMDRTKFLVQKPADQTFVMLERDLGVFGESATRGRITRNCLKSMKALGVRPNAGRGASKPARKIIRGTVNPWTRYIASRFW